MNNTLIQFGRGKPAKYLVVMLAALLLFIPALYNGYPILNNDDATYLWAGFVPTTPMDRPIGYGIFLRLTSFNGITLFTSALAQCWLMSWLIARVFRRIVGGEKYHLYFLATISAFTFCTSVAWISSELLPDVYTSFAMLCLVLILLQRENRIVTGLLFFIYTACIAMHMSQVIIFTTVLTLTLLLRKRLFLPEQVRTATLRICLGLCLTLGCILTMGYALNSSKHVFGMAAILEQGILKPYLDETCPTEHYKICAFKDDLNTNANFFLWYAESPLYLTGGWEANKEEYDKILKGTLTKPRFLWMRIKMSAINTCRQALQFGIGDGNYPVDLLKRVKEYIPGDEKVFLAAKQHKDKLLGITAIPNILSVLTVIASLLILLWTVLFSKNKSNALTMLIFFSFTVTIVNVWACATFSQINGRYGCRVMWLIPLCAVISLLKRFASGSGDGLDWKSGLSLKIADEADVSIVKNMMLVPSRHEHHISNG